MLSNNKPLLGFLLTVVTIATSAVGQKQHITEDGQNVKVHADDDPQAHEHHDQGKLVAFNVDASGIFKHIAPSTDEHSAHREVLAAVEQSVTPIHSDVLTSHAEAEEEGHLFVHGSNHVNTNQSASLIEHGVPEKGVHHPGLHRPHQVHYTVRSESQSHRGNAKDVHHRAVHTTHHVNTARSESQVRAVHTTHHVNTARSESQVHHGHAEEDVHPVLPGTDHVNPVPSVSAIPIHHKEHKLHVNTARSESQVHHGHAEEDVHPVLLGMDHVNPVPSVSVIPIHHKEHSRSVSHGKMDTTHSESDPMMRRAKANTDVPSASAFEGFESTLSRKRPPPPPAPVHCEWSPWASYSSCTKTCGGGTQKRTREIRTYAAHGGRDCFGNPEESQECSVTPCPIDCEWGPWGKYGSCSKTCGGGTKTRSRSYKTMPKHGGTMCMGATEEDRDCNVQSCPVVTMAPATKSGSRDGRQISMVLVCVLVASFLAR